MLTFTNKLWRDFIQSSLVRHRIYKGGMAHECDIHRTVDLEIMVCPVTVSDDGLKRNL